MNCSGKQVFLGVGCILLLIIGTMVHSNVDSVKSGNPASILKEIAHKTRIRNTEYLVEFEDDPHAKSKLVNLSSGQVVLAKVDEKLGTTQEILVDNNEGEEVLDDPDNENDRMPIRGGAADEDKGNEFGGGVPDFPQTLFHYKPIHASQCDKKTHRVVGGDGALPSLTINDTHLINDTRVWPTLPDHRLQGRTEHERCHRVMLRMLRILKTTLEALGASPYWFITHGTLLGAVRHGGIIPWDVDIDVAMPRAHLTLLRQHWRRYFPRDVFLQTEKTEYTFHMWTGKERQARLKDRYSSFGKVSWTFYKNGKKYKQKPYHVGVHIDLIPLQRMPKKKGGGIMILSQVFTNETMFYPTREVCFEGVSYPAPNRYEDYLTKLYGQNYMDIPSGRYDNFQEELPPCYSTTPSKGSQFTLFWRNDHPLNGSDPITHPRGDPPWQSYEDDVKQPYPPEEQNPGPIKRAKKK